MTLEKRNAAIWKDYTDFSYRGISNKLTEQEETVNLMGSSSVFGGVYIINDKNRIKIAQLEDMAQFERDQITDSKAIADHNAETKRTIMALKSATNDYVLAIVKYATEVKNQIADARILAIELSENEVALAEQKATLSAEKSAVKIEEIDMRVQLEEIERKNVEIEKSRAELSVAKANTKVIMSEIAVEEAELAVIDGRIEKAMAEIKKIELTVQIASVLADLVVKQIASVRLESERADVAAISDIITIKLTAALALIDEKIKNVQEKTEDQEGILDHLGNLQVAKLDEQQIWLEQATSEADIQNYKEIANDEFLKSLRDLSEMVDEWSIKIIEASSQEKTDVYKQNAKDAAKTLKAQAEGYMKKVSRTWTNAVSAQHIVKGKGTVMGGGCGSRISPGIDDDKWEVDL